MKILYVVHQFYPKAYTGTEKFVLQLAQACQQAGHTVNVVTYDMPSNNGLFPASALRSVKQRIRAVSQQYGVNLTQLWTFAAQGRPNPIAVRDYVYQDIPVLAFARQRRPTQSGDPALLDFARELLQRERPDLIHAGHTLRVVDFLTVAAELGIPYLLTLTDFGVICPNCKLLTERGQLCHGPRGGEACRSGCPTLRQKQVRQRLDQMLRLLQQAAQVVAPSHFLADKVAREFSSLDLKVIPYGMDTQALQPNSRCYPNAEPLRFCFAGALIEAKGVELLLSAFQALPDRNSRLEIYGTGPLLPTVQRAAQADQRITYGGCYAIEQLNGLLNRVDVVVVPSVWHENLPLVMQEAQAASVPTLVSDVGGMTECVTDGVNGFTFRVGDVADLQRKMQVIIDQPAILNGIKENIRNPQPGHYRVTSLAEEAALYLKEYEKILALSAE